MYKNALFDVDGTIFNTFSGVSKCIREALVKTGNPSPEDSALRRCLGPGIMDSLTNIFGLKHDAAVETAKLYREIYKEKGIYDCHMYEGYPQIFERLKAKGIIITAASSKPKPYLEMIFDKFDITKYFDKIEGPGFDGHGSDKSEILAAARVDENAIMIGDRKFDILAAQRIGIPSIGVTYGFMEAGEFEQVKPTFVADTADDIYEIITKGA